MNADTVYWIWLQTAMGIGARIDDILGAFDTARRLYESSDYERRLSGVLNAKQIARLEKMPLSAAETIARQCTVLGQDIVTPDDDLYPAMLRSLPDLPAALYVQGDLSCLRDTLCISVVGSRSASLYSLDVTRQLCADLAKAGALVVSGCALGVDSAAHTGALSAGGKTAAVLGCGLDTPYLAENAALRAQIAANGALLSEYPPASPALARHFPLRNRIISGLSSGVVVIEAGEKSGSLITARCAAEQGRDVFGVPGDLTSLHFTGVHRLIRDGAKPVFSARDVLEEYVWVYDDLHLEQLAGQLRPSEQTSVQAPVSVPDKSAPQKETPIKKQPSVPLSPDAQTVYDAMGTQALYTDDLVRATKLEPNRVFTALTELEIYGLIQMVQGKRYRIQG